jgi:hypothetical protein
MCMGNFLTDWYSRCANEILHHQKIKVSERTQIELLKVKTFITHTLMKSKKSAAGQK